MGFNLQRKFFCDASGIAGRNPSSQKTALERALSRFSENKSTKRISMKCYWIDLEKYIANPPFIEYVTSLIFIYKKGVQR
jgi:hypothetical protein